ncbi:hypothetical protein [Burkholderia glumae]|uniref:hypothetical protein n=1 Tax=Burkholderia glumae TaxID=337 RepID=UPI000F5D6F6C|nr:hypothetical protein [Burkholderia glumae]
MEEKLNETNVDLGGGGGNNGGMDHEKRLAVIEATLPNLMTRSDGESLRADLHKMDSSVKTWMIATILGLFFGFAGLFFAMSNATKSPSMQPVAPPPVIINVPPSAAAIQPSASTSPPAPAK